MDVPSWHPANQEADSARDRLLAGNAASKRTEFTVMAGSSADTSTEAGRQLLNDLTHGGDGGGAAYEGRGFFDASDRLYLLEQKRLEEEEQMRKRAAEKAELQSFRAKAMKLQAEKTSLSLVSDGLPVGSSSVNESNKKKLVPSLVKIKLKKRTASPLETKTVKRQQVVQDKEKDLTKRESNDSTAQKENALKTDNKTDKPSAPARVGLLLGYSSSSSDSETEA